MTTTCSLPLLRYAVVIVDGACDYSESSITIMRDGNNCLFPLMRNATHTLADPRWTDLVPLQSIAAHTESLAMLGGNSSKSKITIIALALQVHTPTGWECVSNAP